MDIKGGIKYSVFITVIFFLGWVSAAAYSYYDYNQETPFSFDSNELKSPGNWIKQNQIKIYDDYIMIKVSNASWAQFADTNSMDPILDVGANSIQIKPKYAYELNVGDIISFNAGFIRGTVVHRIIETGYDSNGWYAITKGDNNKKEDPEKVRFDQVKSVLIGVLY